MPTEYSAPKVVRHTVNGRTYLKVLGSDSSGVLAGKSIPILTPEDKSAGEQDSVQDLAEAEENGIFRDEAGLGFVLNLEVPKESFGLILGKGRSRLRELSARTGCKIHVPEPGSPSQIVTVSAASAKAVKAAKLELEILIEKSYSRLPNSHFLCFRFDTESKELQEKVNKLQEVLSSKYGIDSAMRMKTSKLHLTVLMLKLHTSSRLAKVKKILIEKLQSQVYEIVKTRSVILHLKGLEVMTDDPSEARVLYGKVASEGAEVIRQIAEKVISELQENELVDADDLANQRLTDSSGKIDPIFHMTIMNAKYGKKSEEKKDDDEEVLSFDATKILKELGDYDLGKVKLESLELCCLKEDTSKKSKSGFYTTEASIRLP